MIPFNPAPMTSYYRSIVIIGLSCTASEINGDFRRKSHENRQFLPPPVYYTLYTLVHYTYLYIILPTLKGFPLELSIGAGIRRNWNDGATRRSKSFKIGFSRFDTIPACDGQPASLPRRSSKYALCISASRSKKK